jgi:hypothetical protein
MPQRYLAACGMRSSAEWLTIIGRHCITDPGEVPLAGLRAYVRVLLGIPKSEDQRFGNPVQPVISVSGDKRDGREFIRNRPSRVTSYCKPMTLAPIMCV